jgi:hypothetical protein
MLIVFSLGKSSVPGAGFSHKGKTSDGTLVLMIPKIRPVALIAGTDGERCNDLSNFWFSFCAIFTDVVATARISLQGV